MEVLLPYLVWTVILLVALSLVAVLVFGLRGLVWGKASIFTIGSFLIPVLLFGILGLVVGDWIQAGIITMLVMLVLAGVGLVLTGARGVFS
jgi:hypothetical protein